MTRKLVFLNLMLVALVCAAGWQIRERWRQAREREQAMLRRPAAASAQTAAGVPAVPAPEPVRPIEAAGYSDVATRMVFAKDRNPNVIIETVAPPPPEPVPEFPTAYGMMSLGGVSTVFMSVRNSEQKGYKPGDMVGPFQLVSVKGKELELAWKDKKFTKTMEDLKPKAPAAAAAASGPSSGVAAGVRQAQSPYPEAPKAMAPAESDEQLKQAQKADDGGPGIMLQGTSMRACASGDTSPAGAVSGGYRKVVGRGLFGPSCHWEPVR